MAPVQVDASSAPPLLISLSLLPPSYLSLALSLSSLPPNPPSPRSRRRSSGPRQCAPRHRSSPHREPPARPQESWLKRRAARTMAAKEVTPASFANVGREITGERGKQLVRRGRVRACGYFPPVNERVSRWLLNSPPSETLNVSRPRSLWQPWNYSESVGLCCGVRACVRACVGSVAFDVGSLKTFHLFLSVLCVCERAWELLGEMGTLHRVWSR